jgi:hypothetical protein
MSIPASCDLLLQADVSVRLSAHPDGKGMVEKGDDLLEYSYIYLSPGREQKGGEKGAAGLEAGVVPRRLRQATQMQTCSGSATAVCLCAALDWSLDSQAIKQMICPSQSVVAVSVRY